MLLSKVWIVFCSAYLLCALIITRLSLGGKTSIAALGFNIIVSALLSYLSLYLVMRDGFYDDIIRISNEIYRTHQVGYQFLNEIYSGAPLSSAFLYLGVIFGDTRVVSALSTFLSYFLLLFALYLFCKQHEVSSASYFLASIFVINTVLMNSVAFNIRFTLAVSILLFGFELTDYFNKNKYALIIGLICCLLHTGIVPLYLIMFFSLNQQKRYMLLCICIMILGLLSIQLVLPILVKTGIPYLVSLADKAYSYFVEGISFDKTANLSAWLCRIAWLAFSCAIYFIFVISNNKRIERHSLFAFGCISLAVASLMLGFTAVSRYSITALKMCAPLIAISFDVYLNLFEIRRERMLYKRKSMRLSFLIVSLIVVFLIAINYFQTYDNYYIELGVTPWFSYQF